MKRSQNAVMLFAGLALLASCGKTSASSTANNTGTNGSSSVSVKIDEGKKVKLGVVMYSFSDIQGTTIKNYCEYLSRNLPVEFAYEETHYQDDLQPTAVENLISAGCNGIISGYNTALTSCLATCEEANVYYAVALDDITKTDFGENAVSPYFVGGTMQFGGDLEALGKAYAASVVHAGLKNIGGVSFPAWAFTDGPAIYNGFKSEVTRLDSTATVQDLEFASGFMQTDVEAATNKVLTDHPDVKAIFGMSSGIDYVYPVIRDKGVKLISMGYDDSVSSLIESGNLVVSGNNNHVQAIASCVARLFNGIDGKTYSDATTGTYNKDGIVNGVAAYPLMDSVSAVNDYKAYGIPSDMANGPVSAAELRNVMLRYNANAKLADLNTLTNRSIAEIKTARTK
jgi:ABC-type sugar transport system substrate-binding protein